MDALVIVFGYVVFFFTLWLGLYLLNRDPHRLLFRLSGIGLVAYATGVLLYVIDLALPGVASSDVFRRIHLSLVFLPAVLWTGALVEMLPDDDRFRELLRRLWLYSLLPLGLAFLVLAAATPAFFERPAAAASPGPAYLMLAAVVLLPLLAAFLLAVRSSRARPERQTVAVLLVVTLFLGLGTGLLLFPLGLLPHRLLLFGVGADLLLLGFGIAFLDAFEEGEALLPDAVRSLLGSVLLVSLFTSQVLVVALRVTGIDLAMLLLLAGMITAALVLHTSTDRWQGLLDRLAFADRPAVRRTRAELRAVTSALPRLDDGIDASRLSPEEFMRFTRRALAHFGDLSRLASSPLIHLPLIGARLAGRGAADNTLERARELKRILVESIVRLKPAGDTAFGVTDEWRHYNVLFFPYVEGVRPFSRRTDAGTLDGAAFEALEWFRTHVPERTFYNWQTTAAGLVAQDLRERSGAGTAWG